MRSVEDDSVPSARGRRLDAVVEAAGRRFRGKVHYVNDRRAGIDFSRTEMPTLPLDEPAALRLSAPWLGTHVELEGKVRSRAERRTFRRYGFEFECPEGWSSDELHRLLDRRSAVRVEPSEAEPVEVCLRLPSGVAPPPGAFADLEATGRLTDISTTGIGVVLEPHVEVAFAAVELVEASFCLPPHPTRIELAARIRFRRLEKEALCYGLRFDAEHSRRFKQQRTEIEAYIARRKREWQQERPPARDAGG
jgi:hypothetical protein